MTTRPARAPIGLSVLTAATLAVLGVELWLIFGVAPIEQQMGIVQKIFYFHVPSAYAMYVGYVVAGVGAGMYLWKRDAKWDALAAAGSEVGLLFSLIVLITGPLWARKAWGTFWTWDPRLTTTLLSALLYFAVLVVRQIGNAGDTEKRFAAGLALLGIPNALLVHYSVQLWRGQHPEVLFRGGGLAPSMKPALYVGFLLMTLLAALLIWARTRSERQAHAVRVLTADLAERGLLEEA